MSIIPISRLQATDLAMLGTNVQSAAAHRAARRPRRRRGQLGPVNRSLSLVGEKVDCLFPTGLAHLRHAYVAPPL